MSDTTRDSGAHDSSTRDSGEHLDPRLEEPEGDRGMPGEVIDTPSNMPGDQPVDDRGPNKTDLERDPDA